MWIPSGPLCRCKKPATYNVESSLTVLGTSRDFTAEITHLFKPVTWFVLMGERFGTRRP